MSELPSELPQLNQHSTNVDSPATGAAMQAWIEALKRADRHLFNLMAMEAWSIAKTMDDIFPGFWHRFMTNRRLAMQQFQQMKKKQGSPSITGVSGSANEEQILPS